MSRDDIAATLLTTTAVGVGGAVLFWAVKKAGAAENAAGKARAEAGAAHLRAKAAVAAAVAAGQRETAARIAAIGAKEAGDNAGRIAAAAIARANDFATKAGIAAEEARGLAARAGLQQEAGRRAAIAREAQLKDEYARGLAAQAAQARGEATKAAQDVSRAKQGEADANASAEREGRLKADQAGEADRLRRVADAAAAAAGLEASELEAKRVIVAQGFQDLVNEVKRQKPTLTDQQAVNLAATHMRKQGILLEKPNAGLSFWKLPRTEIQKLLVKTINLYVTQELGTKKAVATTPDKTAPKPAMTTQVEAQKFALVRNAYTAALNYAIDVFRSRKKQILTPAQALDVIEEAFRRGSVPGPGFPAVPPVMELNQASPFWAYNVAQITQSMQGALRTAQAEVDSKVSTDVLALNKEGKYVLVPPSYTYGQVKDPRTGEMIAQSDVKSVDALSKNLSSAYA